MLSKSERLKYRGLFLQAYEKGKKLTTANLILNYTPTRVDCAGRLPFVGFSVSKKYSKKAVLRNLVKRRLREIYRLYRLDKNKQEKLKSIGLLVIAVRGSITDPKDLQEENRWSYATLKTQLEFLLDKIA
jgi:ribonuclease P protein component